MCAREDLSDGVRVERLRVSGTRCRVFFSDRKEPLVLSDELVFRLRLKEGDVLTASQVEKIEIEAELGECDRVAARLLGMRDHSSGELKAKLAQRGFSSIAVKAILARYAERGLLDDARFARAWARRTLERMPSGRGYLVASLQKKAIPRALAEAVVNELLEREDETALAVASLRKRWASFAQFDLERAKVKAYTYLGRRGISYEAARAAFAQLSAEMKKEDSH